MRISLDGIDILTLSDEQKNVMKHDVRADLFDADIVRRMRYFLTYPCEKYIAANKASWIAQLESQGAKTYPSDPFELAALFIDSSKESPVSVAVDGKEVFILPPIQIAIFKLASKKSAVEEISDRLLEKYEQCFKRFKLRWEPEFVKESVPVPIVKEDFARAVFSRNDYKDRMTRDVEEAAALLTRIESQPIGG